jgi:hypothetical protein
VRPTDPIAGGDGEQGSAYLVALTALVVLSILGISVSLVTQTEIVASSQERILERTFYAAESGLEVAIAKALGEGHFGSTEHVAARTELEQGNLMNVRERVQSSPFFCLGDTPCHLCSVNQGTLYVRRNHLVAANATRAGVDPGGAEIPFGRKSLSAHIDVEPMPATVDCLADLPSPNGVFRFDVF